jgi:hypothetical protein
MKPPRRRRPMPAEGSSTLAPGASSVTGCALFTHRRRIELVAAVHAGAGGP